VRRKTFDVLFETSTGLTALVKQPCLWRSGYYFTLSIGFFTGVVTNTWFLDYTLGERFAIILATIVILAAALAMYGFLLHGIMETFGALAGDPVGLICLLGYTTLPFLILTPAALLSAKLGIGGVPLLLVTVAIGLMWMLYLLIKSLEVVYLIDVLRASVTIIFSLLLLYVVFLLPIQLGLTLLLKAML